MQMCHFQFLNYYVSYTLFTNADFCVHFLFIMSAVIYHDDQMVVMSVVTKQIKTQSAHF